MRVFLAPSTPPRFTHPPGFAAFVLGQMHPLWDHWALHFTLRGRRMRRVVVELERIEDLWDLWGFLRAGNYALGLVALGWFVDFLRAGNYTLGLWVIVWFRDSCAPGVTLEGLGSWGGLVILVRRELHFRV